MRRGEIWWASLPDPLGSGPGYRSSALPHSANSDSKYRGNDIVTNRELLNRITARPDVFGGKPIVRDMRVSVELILSLLAQGMGAEDILDDYPDLELEDIHACIAYARAIIAGDSLAAVAVGNG